MKNFALYITISSILALVAGCTSMTTPFADVETNPVHTTYDSNAPFERCMARRGAQRTRLLRELGVGPAEPVTAVVSLRDSAQAFCAQVRLSSETTAEHQALLSECDRQLSADGIPSDAEVTVRSETPAPTVDPRLQVLTAAHLLPTDDDAVCSNRAMGGMNGMAIGGAQVGGVPMIAGVMGSGPGVLGLGGATRNIVFVTQGMSPRVTATVSVAGLASNIQLTYLNGETPITVNDGFNYQVNVICSVNGVPTGSYTHSAQFAKRHPTGTRVMVNALCGRYRE